jgi:hypothetical protein
MSIYKNKMMADKLAALDANGYIENEWESNFIWNMKGKLDKGYDLTDKQIEKLEQIFEQN